MKELRTNLPVEMEAFAGDFCGLFNQIGAADLEFVGAVQPLEQVSDLNSLDRFLREYASNVLFTVELPAICKSYYHAMRFECRELIGLDQQISRDPRLHRFANASSQIGRAHLLNLRPLRENRLVQRYLSALDDGEVHAWHTLVYGLSLSIYYVPLRQGLLVYSHLVLNGFADAAAARLLLSPTQLRTMVTELISSVPKQIDSLINPGDGLFKAA